MYLACDIGGTNGRVAAYQGLDSTEPIETRSFLVTRNTASSPGEYGLDYQELVDVCRKLAQDHGYIQGVGLAVAGRVDSSRSSLLTAGNIGHWVNRPLVKDLSLDLNTQVVLGNDAEALALADAVYGVGQQDEFQDADFMSLIWGTGIGGCCVRYGRGGITTIPAEPGHLGIMLNGAAVCGCGQRGCLEAYASGRGIEHVFMKPAEALNDLEWDEVVRWMAFGLRSILAVQPVGLVVVGGGIACKQQWLLEKIEKQLTHPMSGSPKLRLSAFGESAGTLGALLLLGIGETPNET